MSEISHSEFSNYLQSLKDTTQSVSPAQIYLVFGDEFLCRSIYGGLVDALVPEAEKSSGVMSFDGDPKGLADALESVNTYSLLSGGKVVAVLDSHIFHAKKDAAAVVKKAFKAWQDKDVEKAAKSLVGAMGLLDLTMEKSGRPVLLKTLNGAIGEASEEGWLEELLEYCHQKGVTVPEGQGDEQVIIGAVEKGFPAGNHLIITTDTVDKRRKLFTCIKAHGLVVDCTVPKGERRADKMARERMLDEKLREKLSESGKNMEKAAVQQLIELTGGQLRLLFGNLEKVVDFVGDRRRITVEDVRAVVKRTKKDPVFAFTDALTDKNIEKTLFYMKSLMADPDFGHPLQLLAAASNQIRKLLVVKGFINSGSRHQWHSGCTYQSFQRDCMPAVQEHDKQLLERVGGWPVFGTAGKSKDGKNQKAGGKKKGSAVNLVIARNPKNAYPVFQLFRKSERFSRKALVESMIKLQDADIRMKSTGQDPKAVLEQVLFFICK